MLWGRDGEQATMHQLLAEAREGASVVLVLRGDPGIGKTALLDYAASAADGMRVLRGAFGLGPAAGDRFLVSLGVLSLLSELAEEGGLLCLVDEAHWLDHASADALLIAARRLDADGVALLFAARDPGFPAPGLPEYRLGGLLPADAAKLLDATAGELPVGLRHRVLGEADGNPLALIELSDLRTSRGSAGAPGPLAEVEGGGNSGSASSACGVARRGPPGT
ncbi:ATP-binding protein [Nonomuraea turkmeniaca]|uniref:ATP-binding protein n=1 Tax=Nonomuraea turkmeniaca TaxID=103838 RepID=UPI001FE275A9|nr:AAA family ATPase [Nonomuraea turkmeniaca]